MEERGKNYYEVLDIPLNSSQKDIQMAYLRAKNAYSPEGPALYSIMSLEECQEVMEKIDEAYSILSDPCKRSEYDSIRGLNQESRSPSSPDLNLMGAMEDPMSADIPTNYENTRSSKLITKAVAHNRYALIFESDSEMEQEIEQTTEYSGSFLKKIREYKKVDIVRMADMTKVSKTYLKHIENEEFEKMPAAVYVRGFVYQYAKCLKLNPDLVATSYLFRIKKSQRSA